MLSRAVEKSMAAIKSGSDTSPEGVMANMLTLISAMTFGQGHFEGAYKDPDNAWLGVTGTIDDRAIEDAIQYRLQKGMAGSCHRREFDRCGGPVGREVRGDKRIDPHNLLSRTVLNSSDSRFERTATHVRSLNTSDRYRRR